MFITKFCAHIFYGIVIGLVLLTTGCSLATFQRYEPLIQLSVQAATARVLAERPEWTDDTVRITGQVLAFADGTEQVTVAALADYARSQVPWEKLLPEEQALVSTLMAVVQQEIEAALAERGVQAPGEVKVVAAQVVGWVNEIARIRQA